MVEREVSPLRAIRFLTSPFRLARYLFASRDVFGVRDPRTRRLALARSILGILITVAVGYRWADGIGLVAHSTLSVSAQLALSVWATYLLGGICLIVGLIVLAFLQRGGKRRHLVTPLATYGLALLVPLGPALVIVAFSLIPDSSDSDVFLIALYLFVASAIFILWWLAFFICSCCYLVRDVFRAADANPLLAPVISTVVPLLAFVNVVLVEISDIPQPPADVPFWAETVMSVSGIVSTGALAAMEIRRLRRHHGLTFRHAPPMAVEQHPSLSPPRTPPPGSHESDRSGPGDPVSA